MTESIHFRLETIPAGRWSRLEGTTPRGGDAEPRPHLVPKTDLARSLVSIDSTGFIGRTGLCPGEITLDDGSREFAYRFLPCFTEADAVQLMGQLDGIVADLQRAAQD